VPAGAAALQRARAAARGVRANNLKGIDVTIPLGVITCVTGRLGLREVALILDTLYKALAQSSPATGPARGAPVAVGLEHVDKVIHIDQSPIGAPRDRTRRPTPASSPDPGPVRDAPREQVPRVPSRALLLQRERGAVRGVRGGRDHKDRDALHAGRLRHVRGVPGAAVQPETLEVAYKGKSVADVLEMTVDQALSFLSPIRRSGTSSRRCRAWGWGTSGWGSRPPRCRAGRRSG